MTDESDFIIHANKINGDGSCTKLEGGEISKTVASKELAWVHMRADHPKTREWLQREVSYLDSIVIDALLADETRPRVMEVGGGLLMILRGVNLNENERPDDMVSIRLWVDEHRIISLRRRKLKAVVDMRERLEAGRGPRNSGDFVADLSARLFERMAPVLADLDDRTDEIEERIIDDPDPAERKDINDIRKQAITFRRYIAPQKDVMAHMRMSDLPWLDAHDKRIIQESYDRVTRYVEDLDMIRERAQIVKDELANALADRLNKNMYVLSVIAAVFLPLGFLTGLFGINIGGMPGVDDPLAFAWFSGSLVALVVLQIVIFKKMKWF